MLFASLFALTASLVSFVQATPIPRQADGPFTLPPLDYGYNALEPHISAEIMELHHTKHHQAAINALNTAEANFAKLAPTDITEKIRLQSSIKFNGGSHINHSLFWKNLAPTGSGATNHDQAAPKLMEAIKNTWGSYDEFVTEFVASLNAIQGSGWTWLGYNAGTKDLDIVNMPNQDPLLSHVPIIGVDAFEHAFYLQYKNVKGDYFKAIFNVINYEEAEKRFVNADSSA